VKIGATKRTPYDTQFKAGFTAMCRPGVFKYDIACVAGVNGEGEGEQERGRKMGSGS